MKKYLITFLQFIVIFIGVAGVVLLFWEPRVEGRNVNASNFEIYFNDPFLALVYAGSVPFFVGLYQTLKILGRAKQNKIYSKEVIGSLRMIKYCALAIIGFVAVEEIIILMNHGNDDPTGGFFVGFIITLGSVVVAFITTTIEKSLRNKLKKEPVV